MIILGIDPGTATTGYGIINSACRSGDKDKRLESLKHLDHGVITTCPSFSPAERLKKLNNELSGLIRRYQPKILVMESVYFFKNLKTAIPVSRASGVILLTAAKKKIPVKEFTPLQVKFTITGNGRAEKSELQEEIKKILKLKDIPKPDDASDALGIAITYLLKS